MPTVQDPNLFCPPPADSVPQPTTASTPQAQEHTMSSSKLLGKYRNGVTVFSRTRGGIYEYAYFEGKCHRLGDPDFAAIIARFNGQKFSATAW